MSKPIIFKNKFDKLPEEKVEIPVIVNNTNVLANDYKNVLAHSFDDAILMAIGDYLMNVGRQSKGFHYLESVDIRRVNKGRYEVDSTYSGGMPEKVLFSIGTPEEDDTGECTYPG